MKLEKGKTIKEKTKVYTVLSIHGEVLPDMMGRTCYITKERAKSVATKWGIPNNVVEAYLIVDARRYEREAEKTKASEAHCKCGHKRNEHLKSHSINFTGGCCTVKKCRCVNFLSV